MTRFTLKWLLLFVVMSGSATAAEATIVEKAQKGDAAAQFHLGVMYYEGDGVPKDRDEALKWCRAAAANAQLNLAEMYDTGDGVPKDNTEAAKG
jgi:TPR repeat protein